MTKFEQAIESIRAALKNQNEFPYWDSSLIYIAPECCESSHFKSDKWDVDFALTSALIVKRKSKNSGECFKYMGVIRGGAGPDVWNHKFTCDAQSILIAAIHANKEADSLCGDVVSLEKIDYDFAL